MKTVSLRAFAIIFVLFTCPQFIQSMEHSHLSGIQEQTLLINRIYLDGSTLLLKAICDKNHSSVKILLEHKADVNLPNQITGVTPLELAINTDQFNIVAMLINHCADNSISLNQTDINRTLKYAASCQRSIGGLEYLSKLETKPETSPAAPSTYLAAKKIQESSKPSTTFVFEGYIDEYGARRLGHK